MRRLLANGLVIAGGAAFAASLLRDDSTIIDLGLATLWWVAVLVVIRSDLEHFIIPDGASASIAGLGLLGALIRPWHAGLGPTEILANLMDATLAGLGGFAVVWLVGRLYRLASGQHGLGFGDVKLAGASAIWLPPADAALALEIAAIGGLVVLLWRRRRSGERAIALPFGAFLAPAAWLAFVMGPALHRVMDRLG